MAVVIENPVLNSPYGEHFSEEGITDKKVASRRPSSYFVPIAKPRK